MVNRHAVDVYAIELQMLVFELCTQWIVDGFAIGTKWIEWHSIRNVNFGRCFYLSRIISLAWLRITKILLTSRL